MTPVAPPPVTRAPVVGIVGVLLGALISTVYGRITTFGLADIRGAVHASVDEGAWITTAQSVAQMLVAPLAVWLGAAFGVRRVLLVAIPVLCVASLLIPFSTTIDELIAGQVVAGLASGVFIPVTISFIVRGLPPRYLIFGLAAYAFNLELSLNIGASLEGFYLEHWSWSWIFWQNLLVAPLMLLCVVVGIPAEPVNVKALAGFDGWGMFLFSGGLALLYAGLDQGNRLDWLASGLVVGLFAAGSLLLVAFLIHERRTETPWLNFKVFGGRNFVLLITLLALFRFAILGTAFVVPQFLTQIHGFRALQTGDVLLLIALPQFVLAPLTALLLQRVDARAGLAVGLAVMGLASLLVARGLTQAWESDDFLASQVMQALGQTLALTSLVYFFIQHFRPADALTFGALLQSVRLFGGEVGSGFMQTFVRVREGINSNLIGQDVVSGAYQTQARLAGSAARVAAQAPALAAARGTGLLNQAVQGQSFILAYIDAFEIVVAVTVAGLGLVALLRQPPPPPARTT